MATEIKIWQISQKEGLLVPVDDSFMEAHHLEEDLESWIEKDPSILGDDVLVIDRQLPIEGVGRLDLLCVDAAGTFVVVELKRDLTPREAVAQALDYASWLDGASEPEIETILERAEEKLGKPLEEAFTDHFQTEMPELVAQNHRIILAAPRLDAAAERIIAYLANRYAVQINAVFFKYARLANGEEILARSILVPDELKKERAGSRRSREKLRKYDVTTPEGSYPNLSVRKVMLVVCQFLVKHDLAPEELERTIGKRLFESVDRQVDGVTMKNEILRRHPNDRFADQRYFIHDDELIAYRGRTYALTTQWSKEAMEAAITALPIKFGQQGISFRTASGSEDS
jgi:hypothetical protein